jgi:hypothetical protein
MAPSKRAPPEAHNEKSRNSYESALLLAKGDGFILKTGY